MTNTASTLVASGADDVALSADQQSLYVAMANGDIEVFDLASHALVNTWHVGASLGALSVSPDGTFLLAVEKNAGLGLSTVYRVNTSDGSTQTFSTSGSAFQDVQVVDSHTAIFTGGSAQPKQLDLSTGTFSNLSGAVSYSNYSVMTGNGHYTLIGEQGISDGPLFLYDSRTHSVTASGDDYQSPYTGFNFGNQAVSENAGLVLQWIYYGTINVYDLNLHYLGSVQVGEPIAGLTFDENGDHVFVHLASGNVVEYSSNPFTQIASYTADPGNDQGGYGNGLVVTQSGEHVVTMDYSTYYASGGEVQIIDVAASNNTLVGNSDANILVGAGGDDSYTINNAGDRVIEYANEGTDTANASVSFTLPDNVENLNLTGSAGINGTGNALDNAISGNSAANTLDGGSGNDTLLGGDGNDTLHGGPGDDSLDGGNGFDTATYSDAQAGIVADLTLASGQVHSSGSGDPANLGSDTLSNIEAIVGSSYADVMTAGSAAMTFIGGAGDDTLTGGAGDDTFVGGAGNDTLSGGAGFDTVDYSQESGTGDVHVNLSSVGLQFPSGVFVGGARAIDTYGNTDWLDSIEHVITGAGNDEVMGSAATGTIETGAGNDLIWSNGGDDTLIGGSGDDTYYATSTDTIVEQPNGGLDAVVTDDVAYALPANVEVLLGDLSSLSGHANDGQSLTGNELDNYIVGGNGPDVLNGGAGNDQLSGGAGTDTLTGGSGTDMFWGTAANMSGDTITDFSGGDKILFTDATLAGFSFSLSGHTLTYTGGSLSLTSLPSGHLVARAAPGGGVQLSLLHPHDDFNGDGRSDVLWRDDSGRVTDWLGQANSGLSGNFANADANAGTDWHIAGTGDFDGDGRADILWRNDNGNVTNWLGQANGGFVSNFANAFYPVDNSWHVAGTGDFNGDGRSDILWRDDSGRVTDWLGQSNSGFSGNFANADANAGTDWHIAGTGDFNGDGIDDVLWRNDNGNVTDWLGQSNGGFASNFGNAFYQVDNSWHVAGTGDFNGDGLMDILWRNNSGEVTDWLGQANGGFVSNFANADANAGTDWHIVSTGDFNGDAIDDILWRNDNGNVTNWLGQTNGSFASNFANAFYQVDNSWHVQDPFIHF